MILSVTTGGGCEGARRILASAALLIGLGSGAHLAATGGADASHDVVVREQQGVYAVSARFAVPQSLPIALAVLTDYEAIPRFLPDVKSSIVRERSAARVIVEQEAVSRVMMFSKRIHLRLEVNVGADVVSFRDASGRSFERYAGTWRLQPDRGQTLITYELVAKPAFSVPQFLIARLLKRDALQMIEQLRAEMAARSLSVVKEPAAFGVTMASPRRRRTLRGTPRRDGEETSRDRGHVIPEVRDETEIVGGVDVCSRGGSDGGVDRCAGPDCRSGLPGGFG